jgi:cell division protein ZapE
MTQEAKTPLNVYRASLAAGSLRPDSAQEEAIGRLDALYRRLTGLAEITSKPRFKLFSKRLETASKQTAGIYVWGAVGRGKSMLMDSFVDCIKASRRSRRVHFHAFMIDVHRRLHHLRRHDSEEDLLPRLIHELAQEQEVLYLDEFQVTDVTDAMILSRLFGGLMDAGVVVLFTSNRPPRELYQHGLQREQFLKFVDLLEARIEILELKSPCDYRLAQLKSMHQTYMFPRDSTADDFLIASWEMLTHGAASQPLELQIQGRMLHIEKHYHGIAWLTFGELCVRPLGAGDYLELARVCHTVLLQGIPALTPEHRNEARRFVTLVDALYDHRVKLIATAATAPEGIYPAGDGNFEFARTVSRLIEMQSETYLAQAHIA